MFKFRTDNFIILLDKLRILFGINYSQITWLNIHTSFGLSLIRYMQESEKKYYMRPILKVYSSYSIALKNFSELLKVCYNFYRNFWSISLYIWINLQYISLSNLNFIKHQMVQISLNWMDIYFIPRIWYSFNIFFASSRWNI